VAKCRYVISQQVGRRDTHSWTLRIFNCKLHACYQELTAASVARMRGIKSCYVIKKKKKKTPKEEIRLMWKKPRSRLFKKKVVCCIENNKLFCALVNTKTAL
jgi:hypothetical protein